MEAQPHADVNWLGCRFEVVDEGGEIVFELPFSDVVELRPKPNWPRQGASPDTHANGRVHTALRS
jgi:hypothetical protein